MIGSPVMAFQSAAHRWPGRSRFAWRVRMVSATTAAPGLELPVTIFVPSGAKAMAKTVTGSSNPGAAVVAEALDILACGRIPKAGGIRASGQHLVAVRAEN